MGENLTIESITIEGLRGFNDSQTIEFKGSNALISGMMGSGKSSTLCAIEWVLFGNIAYIKCSESRTQAEFVNANKIDQKAKVILKLKGDNHNFYIVQREKHAKKRDSDLTFTTPDSEFEGDDAANQIYSIFGTFEDFHRSIFLHQEAVRTILTENPEERDTAMDRLFGLERTRELMSAIPLSSVRKEYEKLENEKAKIEERIKGATQQAEREMEKARKEASEMKLKKEDLKLSACINRFKEIIKVSSNAAEDCGIEKATFLEPSSEDEVSKGLTKIKKVIRSCRMQISSTSKLNELRRNWEQINEAKESLEDALTKLNDAIKDYKKKEKEWGSLELMEKEGKELKLKEKQLKEEREAVDSTYRLIADGIEVLSKQKVKNCPICDSKISQKDVLSRLETKVHTTLQNRLSAIIDERKKVREKILQLGERSTTLSKAIKVVEDYKKEEVEYKNDLGKILQLKSKKEDMILKKASEKLDALQKDLKKAEKALTKKYEILEGIEDSSDKCRAIVHVLQKEAEYEKIRETFTDENSKIEILKNQIDEIAALYTRLQRISEAITTAQIKLARNFIGQGEKGISNYYSRLCGHPYYNTVRIDIDQRSVRGIQKNTYNIKAFNNKEGKETLISTRFSTGQMNCAALSIFLSFSSLLDRKSRFLILDDPSQSLDKEHKKYLVKVLSDVALENQVIIATQDSELEEEIEKGFKPKGGYTSLSYEGWDKDGPTIRVLK